MTIQDLGWDSAGDLYKPRRDDIYTVAYWYQTLPTAPFPKLPDPIDLADFLTKTPPTEEYEPSGATCRLA